MSGSGTNAARLTAGPRTHPNSDARLLSPRNDHPLCRPELSQWKNPGPKGSASSASGMAEIPPTHRSTGSGGDSNPFDPGQLCPPQASESHEMVGQASTLSPAFYTHQFLLDESGGTIFSRS